MDFYGKSGYPERCIYKGEPERLIELRRRAHERATNRLPGYLSLEEEAHLQYHYRSLVDTVCGHLRYPRLVAVR